MKILVVIGVIGGIAYVVSLVYGLISKSFHVVKAKKTITAEIVKKEAPTITDKKGDEDNEAD